MNRYLEHMHTKPTHERRQHAMKVAGVITALVFVGWVTTLSLNLATGNAPTTVAGTTAASQTAAAAASSGYQTGNQLIVSTTTGY